MAKATITSIERIETRLVPVTDRHVVLTLSEDEAATLRAVCECIGGDMRKSRRRDMDAIGTSLSSAGIKSPLRYDSPLRSGSIHFRDDAEGK